MVQVARDALDLKHAPDLLSLEGEDDDDDVMDSSASTSSAPHGKGRVDVDALADGSASLSIFKFSSSMKLLNQPFISPHMQLVHLLSEKKKGCQTLKLSTTRRAYHTHQ